MRLVKTKSEVKSVKILYHAEVSLGKEREHCTLPATSPGKRGRKLGCVHARGASTLDEDSLRRIFQASADIKHVCMKIQHF